VWILATAWYLVLNIYRDKIKNHFRTPTTMEQCDYIMIEKRRNVIQMNTDNSTLMEGVAWLERFARRWFDLDHLVKTVPVQKNGNGDRYFEFQSTRYTCVDGRFEPAVIDMSMKVDKLREMNGLSQSVAACRLEQMGPNFIQVVVPGFFSALWEE
jgi:cation-transporting ATPase 13A3/4/5